ncbi:TIGR04500 family putative peptide maturation system protein [Archangium violaceum]|uniref:TIGR04500 family putative peptide maturation system protein n=1 Tax=Archangium violaceum TaxID=83451 RepID=UPI0036D91F30
MNESILAAARDAMALLVELREERTGPEAAQARFQALRARHPEPWMNIVWEHESYQEMIHYDILVGDDSGTFSLSYCADEELPWPVRGIQRFNESVVVRVNDAPIRISEAITSLDHAWHTLHIGRHLLHMSLIDQEIRARGIETSDEELAEALVRFRKKRRLFTPAQVELWMVEHGTTQAELERHLRDEQGREKLKEQVVAGQEEAYFKEHRSGFERVRAARLYVPERDEALRLYGKLRGNPSQLLTVAQARFVETGDEDALFTTLERRELDAEQAALVFGTQPGELTGPVPSGEGYELLWVMQVLPGQFDETTRQRISSLLFDAWLEEKRRSARVEWFWGADEAAPIPAMSL